MDWNLVMRCGVKCWNKSLVFRMNIGCFWVGWGWVCGLEIYFMLMSNLVKLIKYVKEWKLFLDNVKKDCDKFSKDLSLDNWVIGW